MYLSNDYFCPFHVLSILEDHDIDAGRHADLRVSRDALLRLDAARHADHRYIRVGHVLNLDISIARHDARRLDILDARRRTREEGTQGDIARKRQFANLLLALKAISVSSSP